MYTFYKLKKGKREQESGRYFLTVSFNKFRCIVYVLLYDIIYSSQLRLNESILGAQYNGTITSII